MSTQIDDLSGITLDDGRFFVVVEEDSRYPSQLVVQAYDQEALVKRYSQFLSGYSVLIETGLWHEFEAKLEADGFLVYLMPSAMKVLEQYEKWSAPLVVDNYHIKLSDGSEGSLYPYQQYGLNQAVSSSDGFFFFNWGTGTGKGTAASAGSQELFNRGLIDVVFVFTLRKMKINMTREFIKSTALRAVTIEGSSYQVNKQKFNAKADRERKFAAQDADVYVMNYEKANFDYEILAKRIKGKRVLFVLDEVQKILVFNGGTPNKAGQGIRNLIRTVKNPYVWPMSATVIDNEPETFWRLFDLPKGKNKLGLLSEYRDTYTSGTYIKTSAWGDTEELIWDHIKLEEVRHRIAPWSHSVRKSDPGIKEFFKDIQFIPVPIEMSDEDRKLYNTVLDFGAQDPDNWGQYYRVLRYICDTAEGLKYSNSEIAKILVEKFPNLSSKTSAKLERLADDLSIIKDQGDKAVVFCSFTNMGLFRVSEYLDRLNIKHVVHYGVGMTDKQAQKAQDDFKSDPSITVFLSSDAGAMGLNFQEARFVIHFDVPYSYVILRQRSDRIDRVNSYLDGLTVLAYYMTDTVQERIMKISNERRMLASTVQGTEEELTRVSQGYVAEDQNLKYLMFGTNG